MSTITINASSGSNGIFVNADTFSNMRSGSGSTAYHLSIFGADAVSSSEMGRFFSFFDLSSLTGTTLNTVTLRIPAVGSFTATAGGTSYVTSHTGSDPVSADSAHWNSIAFHNDWGNKKFNTFSTSGNNDITVDPTKITVGAVNKIGLIHSSDFNNSAPSGTDQFTSDATTWTLIIDYTPASPSASQSPSSSTSPSASQSPSSSVSPSLSPSSSLSPSGSASASVSPSSSISPSSSLSPSSSVSPSTSPSASISPSASASPSSSSSPSQSPSASLSPSKSSSSSMSPVINTLSVDFVEVCFKTDYNDEYVPQSTRFDQNEYIPQATRFDQNLYVTQGTAYVDEYDICD